MTQTPNADAATKAFSEIPALLEAAPALVTRGRFLDCDGRLGPMEQPFFVMAGLGHFPMSENPEQFRRYIAPVLAEITKVKTSPKQGVHA